MKKKVFISQPMRGKTDEQILEERNKMIEKLKEVMNEEFEVLETFYEDFTTETRPLKYLARSISDLAEADIVCFVEGWQEARGCVVEHMCAKEYGIDRLY